jgi:hypothetical protein
MILLAETIISVYRTLKTELKQESYAATVMKLDDDSGSGGAPVDRGGGAVCMQCSGRVCRCVAGAKGRAGAQAWL